jgi:hypothetical protein
MDDQAELRLKVLELAQVMLHNSYVETKARIHNEWSLKADVTWKTTQRMLPYPTLPTYFTESDVLRKVMPLWKFVRDGEIISEHVTSQVVTMSEPSIMHDHASQSDQEEPLTTHVNHVPDLEIPQPVSMMQDVQPDFTPPVQSAITSESPIAEIAPMNKGLKVLPTWMTARRS